MVITIQSLYLKRWLRSKGIYVWRHKQKCFQNIQRGIFIVRLYYDQETYQIIKRPNKQY